MFRISVSETFDAAHRLPDYEGACNRLHGHTWTVSAYWETAEQDDLGISFDLKELKSQLRRVLKTYFDHYCVNDRLVRPTAENIAVFIYEKLEAEATGYALESIDVEETPGCSVMYYDADKEKPIELQRPQPERV